MKGRRPIFWHEGLFLQPHHLQLQDLFHQELWTTGLMCVLPFPKGFLELEIRREALVDHKFEIVRLELVFSDGTWVKIPGNAKLEGRSLHGLWNEKAEPLEIYLGIKQLTEDRPNVSASSAAGSMNGVLPINGLTRFKVTDVPEKVQDIYAHQRESQVSFLQYDLRLFVGPEVSDAGDYILVKVAEVELDGDEARLSESFIPPLLWAGASKRLWSLIQEIRDRITGRGQGLMEYKATRLGGASQPGRQDFVLILALQCLNRHIPVWHHLTDTPKIHPYIIYGLLRQLVGELATFVPDAGALGRTGDQPELPPYQHNSLRECFEAGLHRLAMFLDTLAAGPEYIIDLLFDGTYYSGDLQALHFEGRKRYYLVLESSVGAGELNNFLSTTAKIGTREYLPFLIARALPGLRFHALTETPPALPRRTGVTYFELDTSDQESWRHIQEDQNLALYFEKPIQDLNAQLMLVHQGG
ncbi:MAG: type VI secretion system baseplate subunit TssK [Deltaproteobacteria bacterium]|nr:MAG: type VI secretion system baseplate subunit TssK [Deltaproteobacteria bacterium]